LTQKPNRKKLRPKIWGVYFKNQSGTPETSIGVLRYVKHYILLHSGSSDIRQLETSHLLDLIKKINTQDVAQRLGKRVMDMTQKL